MAAKETHYNVSDIQDGIETIHPAVRIPCSIVGIILNLLIIFTFTYNRRGRRLSKRGQKAGFKLRSCLSQSQIQFVILAFADILILLANFRRR